LRLCGRRSLPPGAPYTLLPLQGGIHTCMCVRVCVCVCVCVCMCVRMCVCGSMCAISKKQMAMWGIALSAPSFTATAWRLVPFKSSCIGWHVSIIHTHEYNLKGCEQSVPSHGHLDWNTASASNMLRLLRWTILCCNLRRSDAKGKKTLVKDFEAP
jgi:hypothetical protein